MMAAGYEARARVTADMSGFVSAARSAVTATNAMTASVRALNAELRNMQQAATQSAAAARPHTQATQRSTQATREQASASQSAAQAAREGARAYNSASEGAQRHQPATEASTRSSQRERREREQSVGSLRAMGREMVRLQDQRRTLMQIQRRNGRLTAQESAALQSTNERLGQVRRSVSQLNDTQREQVRLSSDLARAQQVTSSGMASMTRYAREQAQVTGQGVQVQRESSSSLRSLAQEQVRLGDQRRTLMRVQREGNTLSREESAALAVTRDRLRELGRANSQLNTQQRAVVSTERDLVRARQATGEASRNMAAQSREMARSTQEQNRSMRESTRMAADFNGSLWSMRSAVQDVGGSMQQLWMTSRRVTEALWENFSAQEMTIAQISRVSQATTTEMQAITSSVREMSTEIPIAFDELGRITMLGSQVGVANESLTQFTETVALFSATSEVSADQTAMLMARIMEMTNLNQTHGQESVQNLGSAVAFLGSNMVATDQEILTTIESIATMTTQAGMSAEATTGLGAAMASLRIRPEIARGATQRVFLQLSQAIDGTSSEMQRLTEITGMSQQELQNLRDDNFDAYFMTIMESLNGAYEAGEDLVPMLREIGILNSRDAETVARLAANYNVLESGMTNAHSAFEDGNYLYEESGRIFDTLASRVQILSNTWQNFLFTAVEAIAPFLTTLVDAATAAIEFADSLGLAPVLGWGAVLLGLVGTVGLLSSGIANLSVGMMAIRGTWNMLTAQIAANTAATAANTGTTAANAAATTTAATAKRGYAIATTAATVASRAFMLASPLIAIAGLVGVIQAARDAWISFSGSTDAARNSILDAN